MHEQLNKFNDQITKIEEDIGKIHAQKDEARENYYKAKLEYELEADEIYHKEQVARRKQQLVEREEYRKKIIEERKQQMQDRPNPYEKEIETCDHLIAYMNRLKAQLGLADEKEQSIQEVVKTMNN